MNDAWPWWATWRPTVAIRLSFAWHAMLVAGLAWHPAFWVAILAGFVANHAILAAIGAWPRSRALGLNLTRLPPDAAARGEIALTFDDGPDPEVTPRVLDLLDRAGARASFFCIGSRAAACPGLIRDILARGHSIENHTMHHPNLFACRGIGGLQREIGAAQRTLREIGAPPRFFRPPMGIRSPFLDPALSGSGLAAVAWTRRGYDAVDRDPARVLARLTRHLAAGDILLLHDGSCARTATGAPVTMAVLPALLDAIARNGLRAVSLPMAFSAAEAPVARPRAAIAAAHPAPAAHASR